MEKIKYVDPTLEVVEFQSVDVVTTSGPIDEPEPEPPR